MAIPYTAWSSIVKLYSHIVETVFPTECLSCGIEGEWLCNNCARQAIRIKAATCPFCDRLSPLGKTCSRCRKLSLLTGSRSIWYYQGPIPTVVQRYKYQGITACREWIAPRLLEIYWELPLSRNNRVIITSVPSSTRRIIEHGYNQSEYLARDLARHAEVSYQPLLSRQDNSVAQVKLSRQDRLKNSEGQFKVLPTVMDLTGITIVLVDDVITTGATLSSCTAALKSVGAKQVWGLTIAKD